MKNKLLQFMVGRYGFDQFYRFQLACGVICFFLSSLFQKVAVLNKLLYVAAVAMLAWALYRALSRNVEKRYLENLHYLELLGSMQRKLRISKEKFQQRKEFKFFVCPNCKTNLRVPRGKGKVNITCSKCGTRFQGKT